MSKLNVTTPFNIELEFDLASIIKRIAAYLIDFALAAIYGLVMHLTFFKDDLYLDTLYRDPMYILLIVVPIFLYPFICEVAMNGQSAGKKVMGIRAVNSLGNSASISQIMLRWILSFPNIILSNCAFLVWIYPGFIISLGVFAIPDLICMAITSKNQRIGDLAANTVMVNTRYEIDIDQTIFREVSTDVGYEPKYPEVMRLSDKDINSLRNLIIQKRNRDLDSYAERVSGRIEVVLSIQNKSGDPYLFFEELLTDYNYFTQINK